MLRGFFPDEVIEIDHCDDCKLYEKCKTPKMKYSGLGKKSILIISKPPSQTDDEIGTQFSGESGDLFRDYLSNFNISLDNDCWKINILNCKKLKPTKKELKCCKPRIDKVIQELKPKFIWLVGTHSTESFFMGKFKYTGINTWRKFCIPDKSTNAWLIPMYCPSEIIKKPNDESLKETFRKDLKFAVSCLRKKPPIFEDIDSQIELLTDYDDIMNALEDIKSGDTIAFDYETTGLKPFRPEHRIWSLGIATSSQKAFSFPINYPYLDKDDIEDIKNLWIEILLNNRVKKISHNMSYEDLWSRIIFKLPKVNGWNWDTMNAAHLIDDRSNITGLKIQSYINFGVEGYDEVSKNFIAPKDCEIINSLDKMKLNDLLKYNAIDALMTYKLYEKQRKIINRSSLKNAYNLTHKGMLALNDIQINGIEIDELYCKEKDEEFDNKIKKAEEDILNTKEAEEFKKLKNKELDIRSNKDLKFLLYDIFKITPDKLTTTGQPSVDKEVMESLKHPIAKKIVKIRKMDKIKGTYLAQFIRESYNGKMHPFFNLHTARSFRSSASQPSIQQIPKHDEVAKETIRNAVFPSKDNQLYAADFKSMEVRIIGACSNDPTLVTYINNPKTDMHLDTACSLFCLKPEQVTGELRFRAKNQFVFAEFYGSYFGSCARSIFDTGTLDLETKDGIIVKNILIKKGIMKNGKDYFGFQNHIKNVEKKFWDRFPVLKEWIEIQIQNYLKKGYVQMKFGHRRYGNLSKNKIINSCIQGPAFHCLLWSLIQLNEIAKKKWDSKLIAQIHDEVIFNAVPDELDEIIKTCRYIMTEKIREEFDWITVPLDIEIEVAPVNASWYHMKELKI